MLKTWKYRLDLIDKQGNAYLHRIETTIPLSAEDLAGTVHDGMKHLFAKLGMEIVTFVRLEENSVEILGAPPAQAVAQEGSGGYTAANLNYDPIICTASPVMAQSVQSKAGFGQVPI